eukprot:CAMPEP_0118976156 /NCGR_PEP_ID=MMETSP1173-20130426/17896_1 /TAXON_ID=1034831 /ORGANISM="Rhizochromulina marina cf, Strain CCMP1243" /LENGTH=300 /DNA_ID=CAMNT_0006926153 /DNA_START=12 /DNA_END=914 /DNA_ORIENTATION=-
MPQRHSKNQGNMGSMITYHERQKIKDGTHRVRFGVDSQLSFGYCCLSLTPVKDPVVTPSGHMYSREYMLEYLLTKKQEAKRQQALFEAQEAHRQAEEAEQAAATADEAVKAFVSGQTALGAAEPERKRQRTSSAVDAEVELEEKKAAVAELSKAVGTRSTKTDLKRTSYWVPEFTPVHREEKAKPPPERPPSPMTGQPLRMKDLYDVDLQEDDATSGSLDKKYICAVSHKQITFQPAVLLRKAKKVILESMYKDLVAPTMICPITGDKLRKKDIIRLAKSGSSFSAAGSVQSEKYSHTTT